MQIQNAFLHFTPKVRLIVTTGGTGIALRDVTPEATEAICERLIDGIAERMRLEAQENSLRRAQPRSMRGVRKPRPRICPGSHRHIVSRRR